MKSVSPDDYSKGFIPKPRSSNEKITLQATTLQEDGETLDQSQSSLDLAGNAACEAQTSSGTYQEFNLKEVVRQAIATAWPKQNSNGEYNNDVEEFHLPTVIRQAMQTKHPLSGLSSFRNRRRTSNRNSANSKSPLTNPQEVIPQREETPNGSDTDKRYQVEIEKFTTPCPDSHPVPIKEAKMEVTKCSALESVDGILRHAAGSSVISKRKEEKNSRTYSCKSIRASLKTVTNSNVRGTNAKDSEEPPQDDSKRKNVCTNMFCCMTF